MVAKKEGMKSLNSILVLALVWLILVLIVLVVILVMSETLERMLVRLRKMMMGLIAAIRSTHVLTVASSRYTCKDYKVYI